jgi:hypothetical protein
VGGFTARNAENEEESLWSQPDFARFDPAIGTWEALAPLPEGRSSHDAAMIGNTLYVVGGWQMSGEKKDWHHTAWTCDLSQPRPEWKAIPNPPFERRALALAEWQGKLYALGGMRSQGGATTETAVYDPQARTWSSGPRLLGGGMEGFGSSAFAAGGTLYVTTMNGSIQRLSSDGSHFEYLGQLAHPRFFHRLLRSSADELVVVGGASMGTGKIEALERLAVPAADRVDQKAALRN